MNTRTLEETIRARGKKERFAELDLADAEYHRQTRAVNHESLQLDEKD